MLLFVPKRVWVKQVGKCQPEALSQGREEASAALSGCTPGVRLHWVSVCPGRAPGLGVLCLGVHRTQGHSGLWLPC